MESDLDEIKRIIHLMIKATYEGCRNLEEIAEFYSLKGDRLEKFINSSMVGETYAILVRETYEILSEKKRLDDWESELEQREEKVEERRKRIENMERMLRYLKKGKGYNFTL